MPNESPVIMYHPDLPGVTFKVYPAAVDDWAANGWLNADPPADFQDHAIVTAREETPGVYSLHATIGGNGKELAVFRGLKPDGSLPDETRAMLNETFAEKGLIGSYVARALAEDDAPAAAAAAAVDAALDSVIPANLAAAKAYTDAELAENFGVLIEPGLAFAVVDEDGRRTWIEAAEDGGPTPYGVSKLAPSLAPSVGEFLGIAEMLATNEPVFSVVDEDGRRTWIEAAEDGGPTPYATGRIRAELGLPDAKTSPVLYTRPAPEGTALVLDDTATGQGTIIATANAIVIHEITGERAVFTASTGDESATRVLDMATRETRPAVPRIALAAWGDSMTMGLRATAEQAWPVVTGAALGIPVYQGGISGQTSTEIGIRQGGITPAITVTGGIIPAEISPVTVTVNVPGGMYRGAFLQHYAGTLSGVPGTLTRAVDDTWTYTRASAGATVNHPAGAPFVADAGKPYRDWIQVFWAGRNNVVRATILADVAAMTKHLTPLVSKFLILGVCNSGTEGAGTTTHTNIVAINADLSAIYGPRFFDVRSFLIREALAQEGLTPTADDTAAVANDRIPPQLLSDGLHLNAVGYGAVGRRIATIFREKGWA